MAEFLSQSVVHTLLLLALLAALVSGGVYVVGKVRQEATLHDGGASDCLTKFREMHSQGELSDEEYRTIKATLAERLERELNDRVRQS